MPLVKKCRHSRSAWSRCKCSWYADLRDVTGKRTYTNLGADGPEARKRYRLMTKTDPAAPTFSAARQSYLDECAHTLRPQSLARYESLTKHAERYFADTALTQVTSAEIVRMTDALRGGLANSHVRTIRNLTLAILRHANERGMLATVPQVPKMKMARDDAEAEVDVLDLADAEAAIAAMPEPERSLAQIMLWTGLRPSEAVALRPDDDLGAQLSVRRTAVTHTGGENAPKTRLGRRDVDLVSGAREALDRLDWSAERSYRRLFDRWRAGLAAAKLPYVPPKTLRHTNASLRLAAGQSVPYVAQQMGHSPEILLSTYSHVIRKLGVSQAALLEGVRQHASPG